MDIVVAVIILLAIVAVVALVGLAIQRRGTADDRPLGDTPEAHDELSPLDLPPDHPARREAERQSGGPGGTTRGDG